VRSEFVESLGTKDAKEAKELAGPVIARFTAWLKAAENALSATLPEPSAREIAALAGAWYRRRVGASGSEEDENLHWDIWLSIFESDPWSEASADEDIAAYSKIRAEALLQEYGYAATPDTVKRLTAAVARAEETFQQLLLRRADGDWSPDPNLLKFPVLPTSDPLTCGAGCTFDALLEGWALDHGWRVDAKPVPRALYDRQRTLERFATFLGHRDADLVSKADAVRWKEDAMRRGLQSPTVRNDISEMSALWAWGLRNGKLRADMNPFEGTLPPKAAKQGRDVRGFTNAEAATILRAARQQKGCLRWLPWVLCLTGARLNEITQSDKADVTVQDAVNVIHIHDVGEGRSVKSADSRRTVPLHPSLVAEGFLDYVASLPAGSPLFPDVRRDAVFGQRSVIAGRRITRWLRKELGMVDPRISPNHSWRHWFVGACRSVVIPLEVRSAITGHSAKLDESAGYGDGMTTFIRVLASHIAKVPCPVEPLGSPVSSAPS
jgi:integrase